MILRFEALWAEQQLRARRENSVDLVARLPRSEESRFVWPSALIAALLAVYSALRALAVFDPPAGA
jgi:hypothetical protein